jgi:hypothetical protein
MLFATYNGGFGATPSPELVTLKNNVDKCLRFRNSNAFTNDDVGAENNLFCTGADLDTEPLNLLRKFEKADFIDAVDNQLMFDIARTVMRQWRVMGMAGGLSSTEAEMRRIAVQKLTEVGALSPDAAILQMSGAAREETDGIVLLRIITGLTKLIDTTTSANIRTEAVTSLQILASDQNLGVRLAAQTALQLLKNKLAPAIDLEIGPVTVLPVQLTEKPLPGFVVPLVAITGTAIVAAGVLWYVFGRHAATGLSAPGPLRRRAEAQLRRRRSRR